MKTKLVAAQNIKAIIARNRLKQYAVAEKAGIPPKKFNDMLNGRALIKADDIVPICTALGVTANEIFKMQDESRAI